MPNRPEEFPVFTSLNKQTMQEKLKPFYEHLYNAFEMIGMDHKKIYVHEKIIYEIIEKVEQRRVYFHIFHNKFEMGELNEGALFCFWILKFNPFYSAQIPNNILNIKIAFYYLMMALQYYTRKKNKRMNITNNIINDILYAFQYRDLSKEAIMLLAESLVID